MWGRVKGINIGAKKTYNIFFEARDITNTYLVNYTFFRLFKEQKIYSLIAQTWKALVLFRI